MAKLDLIRPSHSAIWSSTRTTRCKTLFHLLFESRFFLRVRTKGERVAPLKPRVDLLADAPEGVAEMIVDRGISRHQKDRIFQRLRRVVETTELEVGPAD